jgi:hypothetical protein
LPADPVAGSPLPAAPETVRRIRSRAVWSLAVFAAAVPASLVGGDPAAGVAPSALLATVFWAIGTVVAVAAAAGALRHWPALSPATRWLAMTPLAGVGLMALLLGVLTLAIG